MVVYLFFLTNGSCFPHNVESKYCHNCMQLWNFFLFPSWLCNRPIISIKWNNMNCDVFGLIGNIATVPHNASLRHLASNVPQRARAGSPKCIIKSTSTMPSSSQSFLKGVAFSIALKFNNKTNIWSIFKIFFGNCLERLKF